MGERGGEMMEGVKTFKYLGRPLDQKNNDWPSIWKTIMRMRTFWRAGVEKLLRREGADPRVAAIFYRLVAHAVLLFGSETWVISVEMERKAKGTHMGFLRQITGERA